MVSKLHEIERTLGGYMADIPTGSRWTDEDEYWRENYRSRPYAEIGRDYDYYSPAYRFGYEASSRYPNRQWTDVESDLSRDWETYEHRGESTWEQIKGAVRDAWDRMTGNRAARAGSR
jgi:hypothetical protein